MSNPQPMPPQAPSPPASPPSNGGSAPSQPSHFFADVGSEWKALSTPGKLIAIGGLVGAIIAVWLIARRGGFGGGSSLPIGLSTQQTGGGTGTVTTNAPISQVPVATPIPSPIRTPGPPAAPQWYRGIPGATINDRGIRFDPSVGGYSAQQTAQLFGINWNTFQDIPGEYSAFVSKTQPAFTIPLGDLPASPAVNIQSIG